MEHAGEMGMAPAAQPTGDGTSRPQPRRLRRWLLGLVAALVVACAVTALVLRWQERTLHQAEHELASGDPQRALALVSYFLESHPEHNRAMALQARAFSATGQTGAAIALYEKVGAATVEDLHAWARAYLLRQSWSRALPLLTQVLRLEPDNADALHEITGCRVRLGLLQEALESARLLSQVSGQEARGLVFVAAIQNDLGNPKAACEAYQQIVELVPDGQGLQIAPEELFVQYGVVLANNGRGNEALPWLERSLAVRPTAAAYYYLGNAHSQGARTEAAEQAWERAHQLDPGGVLTIEALANSALQKRDTKAAQKWLNLLGRIAEERSNTAYLFQRFSILQKDAAATERWRKKVEELRKLEQRREMIDQLVTQAPYSLWANVVRAHRFAAAGNWQQAEDMVRELAREAPQDEFIRELADAIRQRGKLPAIERIPLRQH
jgi:tetratricopeptide (TPR) repeat protein